MESLTVARHRTVKAWSKFQQRLYTATVKLRRILPYFMAVYSRKYGYHCLLDLHHWFYLTVLATVPPDISKIEKLISRLTVPCRNLSELSRLS